MAPQIREQIDLTDAEDRLCALLDEFTGHLEKEKGVRTTCRISGGWVRDKVNLFLSFFFSHKTSFGGKQNGSDVWNLSCSFTSY
ncbi:hypothetical protein M404DRAFT_148000 [Pisolithus tinctorius Marx 270]|uniref:Uncharacterized protein n=1 Tax=Pisolithus tinctorius Marx 270 TaxID=870435 RepID=A0A0C3P590_PISTI|nr:hypothetical protein M404DRAFT_148000 [Pisolithus tinctorius Marx 270]